VTTEEAALYLKKAWWHLASARVIAQQGIPEIAAREAYYAAFQAAEALIFQRTGKIAKTHKGVHGEFARLVKDDPRIDRAHLSFLSQSYAYKAISDYEVGPMAQVLPDDALDTIESAEKFVNCVDTCLREKL